MSGVLRLSGFRALLKDFGISQKERRLFYRKAAAVESVRHEKDGSEKDKPIKVQQKGEKAKR